MKPTSKVIMGATLVMVVTLAIVLGLVLVLLAELYCSILLRRRRFRRRSSNTPPAASQLSQTERHAASSLSSFYAQGVLQAPRALLFPVVSSKDNKVETEKQLQEVLEIHTQESGTSPHHIGLISAQSPSASFVPSPQPLKEISVQIATDGGNRVSGGEGENFVYISNPIYDNDHLNRDSRGDNTPFETPDTSPSRLESGDSSGEDEIEVVHSFPLTPPLTPMKKLPAEACSVSLKDARSLDTSASDSHDNGLSSSSSGSPCTSPSW
ncbi:serine/arginine repetitive matrix protein 2-like [Tripterygium wilfordii]|uniref:Serine/arginine repetitive matrix protein 2-like n=1 Tax=Tripterygium wilfordii TaxID=458696 RepID=A0A7J7D9J9_TRIWF|nr:uncharacterized protein LOC120004735 [Tripterygium wilfordii]KAF5742964.1 serine/arginine repetitive matrix protein 2-like [Tripterygium wilfordii]